MREGKAVIPIKVNKLDDLYMKHDYLKLDLSDHVFNYIEEVAYIIPSNVDIVLEVHYHDEISNNQQQRIKKVFKANYGSDIDDIDYELRKAQKEMVEHSTKDDYEFYQDKYIKLKDYASENPLFQNYIILKEEVQNLLNQISYLIKKDL